MKSRSINSNPDLGSRSSRFHRFTTVGTVGALAFGALAVAGCAAAEEAAAPQTCHEIVKQAVYEQEIDDEVKWFDTAISECDSYDQIKNEMDSYDLRGYTVERFLEKRCIDEAEALANTEVCLVAAPPTTLPDVVEDPEYSGKTLDDRVITVTPDEVEFDGPVPTVIANTVKLADQGCVAVLGVRDDFANYVVPTRKGDIASMYAQHAQSVADFIGCYSEPVVIGPAVPGGTTVPGATVPPTTAAG